MKRERASATKCVQGTKIQTKGPAVEPIYQTSTFVFENQQEMLAAVRGESSQDVYTRWSNPTTTNVAQKMNALEGTETTLVLASGMAAISSAIFGLVKSGDNVIACESIYGGTLHLFEDILPQNGISVDFVEIDSFADAVMDSGSKYSLCYFETPTNPTLGIVDIEKVSSATKAHGITSVIDNTFASPINQRPFEQGVDVVLHSATKYLGGHSDLIAGTVSGSEESMSKIRSASRLLGGTVDPFTSFLLDRGIKTLSVRMAVHNFNALYLSQKLSKDSRIRNVHYPGLQTHPYHSVAKKQMDGYSGILAIDLEANLETTEKFVDSLELFLNAVSLGGVESLASIPALTTHYGIAPEVLAETGIAESTVRVSVGIEDPSDLLLDITQALEKAIG